VWRESQVTCLGQGGAVVERGTRSVVGSAGRVVVVPVAGGVTTAPGALVSAAAVLDGVAPGFYEMVVD
jgi:hypothetical protein